MTHDALPVADAARHLGVSVSTLHTMLRDGRLRGYRPTGAARGAWRVPRSEIHRHLVHTGQTAAPPTA